MNPAPLLTTRSRGVLFRLAAAVLAAAALFAVFGEVRSFGFLDFDDGDYVFRNPHLRADGLGERARWAFTTFHAANWHPLTWLSFIADEVLFGLDPAWCHAENLLLHGLNVALVFAVLARLTGSAGRSALVAALFALHPLRVESVAWVTERKGLLMALGALSTLYAYAAWARRPTPGRRVAVGFLFAAALLAKPQAVALPLVLLVVDWWPLDRFGRRPKPAAATALLAEKAPLFLMAGVAAALTIVAQRRAGAVAPLAALPLAERLGSAVVAPVAYLAKTLWPAGLSPVYPFARPPGWQVAVAAALLAAVTVAAVRGRRTRPWLAAGWLGFLALLAPVSNLFQVGGQAMADRYTYLPHVLLFAGAVWAGGAALREKPRALAAATTAVLLATVVLGVAARRQTALWRGELTLFSHAVAVTRANWKMHYNLANALERGGRAAEAETQYRLALQARPGYPEALNNLGALAGRRGDTALAASLFERAVSGHPGYAPGWFNLGFLREQQGDLAGALMSYGRAAALQPGAAEPRVRLGRVLARLGRREEASDACGAALRLDPDSAGAAACLREAAALPAPAAR